MKPLTIFGLFFISAMACAPAAMGQERGAAQEPQVVGGDAAAREVQSGQRNQRIRGEISEIQQVRLLGDDEPHLLARVGVQGGEDVHVDLGPRSQLQPLNLDEGDRVTVVGVRAQLNDLPIFVATRVHAKQDSVQIDRSRLHPMNRFRGEIEDTRFVRYEGVSDEHLVAKVRLNEDEVILLDLGSASAFEDVNLSADTPIEVVARPGTIDNRRAYIAQDLRVRDSRHRIERNDDSVDLRVSSHSAARSGSERAQRAETLNRGQSD